MPGKSPRRRGFWLARAADRLRVSRWSVYNLIRSNQLCTVKIGRRRLVTPAALTKCIELLEKDAA
jgi:excisionase family DNA binding protein